MREQRRAARLRLHGGPGVIVAVLLIGVTGCQEPYAGSATGPKVAVLGDSISHVAWSYDEIRAAFVPAHRVSVSGVGGAKFIDSRPVAAEYQAMAPDAVVIELGSNDAFAAVGPPRDPANGDLRPTRSPEAAEQHLIESEAALRDLLAVLGSPACVVIVNVSTFSLYPAYRDWAQRWNSEVLERVKAADHRVRIADWSGAVADWFARPEPKETLFVVDLLHPESPGQVLLADLMVREIDACLAAAA